MSSIFTDFAPNQTSAGAQVAKKELLKVLFRSKRAPDSALTLQLCQALELDNLSTYHGAWYFSARGGLCALLEKLAVERSFVAMQGFTCAVVALSIIQARATPLYVDIHADDLSMSFADFSAKASNKKVSAVILQHSFGIVPTDRSLFIDYCTKKQIPLIEDCAHGLVPGYSYKTPSTLEHYLLTSFGRSKQFSSVYGGCVLSNRHARYAELTRDSATPLPSRLMQVRCLTYAALTPFIRENYESGPGRYLHALCRIARIFPNELSAQEKAGGFDHNFLRGYPDSLAALLREQLKHARPTLFRRKKVVDLYRTHLPDDIRLRKALSVSSRYPILCRSTQQKQQILRACIQKRIYLGDWYSTPLAPLGTPAHKLGFSQSDCSTSIALCERILNIPTTIELSEAEEIITTIQPHL